MPTVLTAAVEAVLASVFGGCGDGGGGAGSPADRHPPVTRATLCDRRGRERAVAAGDVLWCKAAGGRVRFVRMVPPPPWDRGAWRVVVADPFTGAVLPDLRDAADVFVHG